MLSNTQIVQAIVNAYALDGFVVVNDETVDKSNEQIAKSTGGKATIYNQLEANKDGDSVCIRIH